MVLELRTHSSRVRSTSTPICARSFAIVAMSIRRGTFARRNGLSASSVAQRIGSAAFFAPEMCASPRNCRPPAMRSLSTALPLFRRQRAHRQSMDLLAHAIAQRPIHELVALHAALAGEGARHNERLEMLPVANHLDV